MKREIKYILFAIFVIVFSCTKEQNNPYDRECPPEIWSPTGLTVSQSANCVTLTWEQQANHFDGFLLERSTDSINWVAVNTAIIDKSNRNYIDSGNLPGGIMYYRISAKADKNQSNCSYAKAICLVPLAPGAITGSAIVPENSQGITYSIAAVDGAASYNWTVPAGTSIITGQGTISIKVNFGSLGGNISVRSENICGSSLNSSSLAVIIGCDYLTFIDNRDGKSYKYIQIGTQVWMAENLAWLPSVSPPDVGSFTAPFYYVYDCRGISVSAAKATGNYSVYGVLYNWMAALTACPAGWHLPSDTEWTILPDFLGGESVAGGKMKEKGTSHWWNPNSGASNESCFSGLPGSQRDMMVF
jgi:uncharacterized protein (TIGR02145 family)